MLTSHLSGSEDTLTLYSPQDHTLLHNLSIRKQGRILNHHKSEVSLRVNILVSSNGKLSESRPHTY